MAAAGKESIIRVGHSPDPDDAFMFFALVKGKIPTGDLAFAEVVEPIEDLNRRALKGELEVTALSAHAYALCAGRYRLLPAGASVGRGYGPILVSRSSPDSAAGGGDIGAALAGKKVALPGKLTTAALVAKLIMPHSVFVYRRFDEIPEAVREGQADYGVLIHEGQLTYASLGLAKLLDFGAWWERETGGLPLPLGLDAVRLDLGEQKARAVSRFLAQSIAYSFEHVSEAMDYAAGFGRGISPELNDRFVRMYVNRDTRAMEPDVVRALEELYRRAVSAGLIGEAPRISILG